MSGLTLAQKIISKHCDKTVQPGELVIARVDVAAVQAFLERLRRSDPPGIFLRGRKAVSGKCGRDSVLHRTGRGDKRGKFLIQTFNPKQELYTILRNNEDFFRHELEFRRRNNQPPFAQLAAIVLSGTNRTLVEKTAKTLMNTPVDGAQTFGPAPAPIFLMRGRVRWRILFKVVGKKTLSHILRKWLHACSIPSGVKIQIDIDPYTFS